MNEKFKTVRREYDEKRMTLRRNTASGEAKGGIHFCISLVSGHSSAGQFCFRSNTIDFKLTHICSVCAGVGTVEVTTCEQGNTHAFFAAVLLLRNEYNIVE